MNYWTVILKFLMMGEMNFNMSNSHPRLDFDGLYSKGEGKKFKLNELNIPKNISEYAKLYVSNVH
jgi:hypothetical protein